MPIISVEINEANTKILEKYAARMNTTVSDCLNHLIAGLGSDRMSALNEETLQAIGDVESRRNLVGPFCSAEEVMRSLNA